VYLLELEGYDLVSAARTGLDDPATGRNSAINIHALRSVAIGLAEPCSFQPNN
jgi:hypothetical protein